MKVPDGWRVATLGELGAWSGGGTPTKSRDEYWLDGTIPWLSPKDMKSDVLTATQDKITSTAVVESAVRVVPRNSVAFVVRSGILERTFPVALVPFDTTLNQDMKAITPGHNVDARWLLWGLNAFERRILKSCRKAGTTVASINTVALKNFQIPVPPLPEQRRIVERIDELFAHLDAAEAGLEKAERRLVGLETSSLWTSTHERQGARPTSLESIGEVRLGRQRSPKNHTGDRMRPYLRAANVDWNKLRLDDVKEMQFSEAEEVVYQLKEGDILLTEASGSPAEVGKSAIYSGEPEHVCFQNTLLRIRCSEQARPDFLQKYLLAEARRGSFMPAARGVGINHLGRKRLAQFAISLPALDEQERAAAEAAGWLDRIERARFHIRAQQTRSAALRRSILAAAFEGRLV